MSWTPAVNNQAVLSESRHLILGDSFVRDLIEIFVIGQTTALSFGGASLAQVIKLIMLGTNEISRSPVDQRTDGNLCWSAF